MPAPTAPTTPEPPAGNHWQVRLLGLPSLVREQTPTTTLQLSPKDAALLAIVALDGPIAPDHAAALIWPAVDGKKADTNLEQPKNVQLARAK
jgi:DNA-binding SARP family transcriptional activator